MHHGLNFRKVSTSDLNILCKLSIETFCDAFYHLNQPENIQIYITKAFSKEQLKYELEIRESDFIFLTLNNQILGYYKTNLSPYQSDLNDPHSIEIERIYVCKAFQNKQFGKFMLDNICQNSKQLTSINYIWLGVWDQNINAIRFYERYGFQKFSSHSFLLGNDLQTDQLMKFII